MSLPRETHVERGSSAELLYLCSEIRACGEDIASTSAQIRPHLSDGTDPRRLAPALRQQLEKADRLTGLVRSLGNSLGAARIEPERRAEVRESIRSLQGLLEDLARRTGTDQALTSRRGLRIPGLGGRPYSRRTRSRGLGP